MGRGWIWIASVWLWTSSVSAWASDALSDSVWQSAGKQFGIDPLLLYAIALQESGQLTPERDSVRPWPWTLHAKGYGALYFPSYEAAAQRLEQLINEEGISNVDIGLMQINWRFNGHLHPNPVQLLLPKYNIPVGARILRDNLKRHDNDLQRAVARYHSGKLERGARYARTVFAILRELDSLRLFSQVDIDP